VKRSRFPIDLSGEIINAIKPPPADSGSAVSDKYDSEFETGNKKHRNLLSSFDHWYTIVSHPFCFVIILVGILALFLPVRYIGYATGNAVVLKIASDLGVALPYIATTIISSVFTKFLERRKQSGGAN
jgi:hypothetical protein